MKLFTRRRQGCFLNTVITWHLRLEWKLADFWIGCFWKSEDGHFDLWICLLPCLPLHLFRRLDETRNHRRLV